MTAEPIPSTATDEAPGLSIAAVTVSVPGAGDPVDLLHGVDLAAPAGTVHAILGASGSGKTTLLRAVAAALPAGAGLDGSIRIDSDDTDAPPRWVTAPATGSGALPPTPETAGRVVGLVPQSPATSLTPLRRVGSLLDEVRHALGVSRSAADLLRRAGLEADTARRYPHELSTGMAQRATMALATVADPVVLLADEPTSALDSGRAADLVRGLRAHADAGGVVLLTTHDLDLLVGSDVADAVTVLHEGRVVETGPAEAVLTRPRHPVTRRMLQARDAVLSPVRREGPGGRSTRSLSVPVSLLGSAPLAGRGLTATVPGVTGTRTLFRDLDLDVPAGTITGLNGPSGVGKSTLIRILAGLSLPDAGRVTLGETPVGDVRRRSGRDARGRVAVVFPSPRAAIDPSLTLGRSIALARRSAERRAQRAGVAAPPFPVAEVLEALGLDTDLQSRYPREVSDGQLQRVALVRALAQAPTALLCDEITAALDAEATAAVLDVLHAVADGGCAVLLVSHDLPLLTAHAERVQALVGGRDDEPATLTDLETGAP